jgi:hypothetical protein
MNASSGRIIKRNSRSNTATQNLTVGRWYGCACDQHPLFVGTGEVVVDGIRYVAVVLVLLMLLAEAAKLAF